MSDQNKSLFPSESYSSVEQQSSEALNKIKKQADCLINLCIDNPLAVVVPAERHRVSMEPSAVTNKNTLHKRSISNVHQNKKLKINLDSTSFVINLSKIPYMYTPRATSTTASAFKTIHTSPAAKTPNCRPPMPHKRMTRK